MMAPAYRLGGRGGKPSWWSHFTVRLWGMAAPDGAVVRPGRRGVQPSRWSQLTVRLREMVASIMQAHRLG